MHYARLYQLFLSLEGVQMRGWAQSLVGQGPTESGG